MARRTALLCRARLSGHKQACGGRVKNLTAAYNVIASI